MSYDIVVRFPNKRIADEFCGQMSDGFGEDFVDFKHKKQKEGTTGKNPNDYEEVFTLVGTRVYFVDEIFDVW